MTANPETVAVLGASNKPHRFSYQALQLLQKSGHEVVPVHPTISEIEGIRVVRSLTQIEQTIDTLTVYVSPTITAGIVDEILALKPFREIFNPGAESPDLVETLKEQGILVLEACTLVLLNTGQF